MPRLQIETSWTTNRHDCKENKYKASIKTKYYGNGQIMEKTLITIETLCTCIQIQQQNKYHTRYWNRRRLIFSAEWKDKKKNMLKKLKDYSLLIPKQSPLMIPNLYWLPHHWWFGEPTSQGPLVFRKKKWSLQLKHLNCLHMSLKASNNTRVQTTMRKKDSKQEERNKTQHPIGRNDHKKDT